MKESMNQIGDNKYKVEGIDGKIKENYLYYLGFCSRIGAGQSDTMALI
jgi:hypothetical protein